MHATLPATWRLPRLTWRDNHLWTAIRAAAFVGVLAVWLSLQLIGFEGDAHAYWSASLSHPYARAIVGAPDAYLYSPAFLQTIAPLTSVGWPIFYGIWTALILGAGLWLIGPIGMLGLLVMWTPVWSDAASGNIHILLALAVVLGMRYPAAWAFPLLTKVTPGIGIAWYVFRGEWRSAAWAVGATLGIVAISAIIMPVAWLDWLALLYGSA